jgi:hypothetical protein
MSRTLSHRHADQAHGAATARSAGSVPTNRKGRHGAALVPKALDNHSLGQSPQDWHGYPIFALEGRDNECVAKGMEPGPATELSRPSRAE